MQPFRTLPFDEDGGREVFDGPVKQKQQSNIPLIPPRKIYPVEGHVNNDAKDQNSEKSSTKSVSSHQNAARPGMKIVRIQAMLALLVCICMGWTLWLILLNVAPNDTVNRVMNTEHFDDGSFWLMVDPTKTMVGLATFGLSVVVIGYLGVFVKMLTNLALETLLLYQMLEAGSPTPLIAIFTVVVATNALACAAMMFVPHERAPLAETLIDVLFDFLIIVGCPMLVIFYCLSSFTFDRAKFAINLEVFPTGWFEQGASMIADAEQTAVIYESLKSLRILTPLNIFTRIGVNMTLCFRLWQLNSSVYPKRHRFGAAFLIVFAIMLIVFVEESMRTSSLACQPHPECVVNARRWTIVESGSLTQCPCIMLIDRDIAPKTYANGKTHECDG
ncbi:hypothetical protein GQ600_26003 [Phytophthora cactorum]|nr:hypothetical protein GQ600_26003 [Phytophthora cactorum]